MIGLESSNKNETALGERKEKKEKKGVKWKKNKLRRLHLRQSELDISAAAAASEVAQMTLKQK